MNGEKRGQTASGVEGVSFFQMWVCEASSQSAGTHYVSVSLYKHCRELQTLICSDKLIKSIRRDRIQTLSGPLKRNHQLNVLSFCLIAFIASVLF